ncbi:hypothetical protein [Methylophilus sp. 3sh_L]|uniref:hypothetical protein n=1 Tax=Methylophilus sp. 3sh_L TaxID=3377114 RepID=UPI00398F1AAB
MLSTHILKKIGNEWIAGFSICCLFLLILKLPNQFIDTNSHDLGSQVIYEYWLGNYFQFGKDIVQNIGPLGFIFYPSIYTGFLPNIKAFVLVFMAISMAVTFYIYLRKLPALQILIFILSLFVVILGSTYDALYYTFALLLALAIIDKPTNSLWKQSICLLLLTVLSLTKGTLLIWAFIVVFLRVCTLLFQSEYKRSILEVGIFCAFFLIIWVFCQQSINNILPFISAMLSFSSGYNEAMAIYEKHYLTVIALILLITYSSFVIKNYVIQAKDAWYRKYSKALMLLLTLFIAWKHGFVRADAHMLIFLQFCLLVAPFYIFPSNKKFYRTKFGWLFYFFVIVFVTAGSCKIYQCSPLTVLRRGLETVNQNAQSLLNYNSYSSRLATSLKKTLEQENEILNVPIDGGIKATGYWGMLPGIFAYQALKYSSAPSNINFASWNTWIMNKNRDFYRDINKAPPIVYLEFETIDNKLIAQDDALAQMEILHQYLPVIKNKRYVLMRRSKTIKNDWYLTKVGDVSSHHDSWISIPDFLNNHPVWVRIKIEQSIMSRVVAFFYKPPRYEITLEFDDGSSVRKKYIPLMGEVGFMIKPMIFNNEDVIDYFKKTSKEKPSIKRFKIDCNKMKFACGSNLVISFSSVEGL